MNIHIYYPFYHLGIQTKYSIYVSPALMIKNKIHKIHNFILETIELFLHTYDLTQLLNHIFLISSQGLPRYESYLQSSLASGTFLIVIVILINKLCFLLEVRIVLTCLDEIMQFEIMMKHNLSNYILSLVMLLRFMANSSCSCNPSRNFFFFLTMRLLLFEHNNYYKS